LTRLRAALIAPCIIIAAFVVYLANGEFLGSYDSAPNSLLALNALQTGQLTFDRFRGRYLAAPGSRYVFVEAPDGHLTSVFPIGTAIVAAPIYGVFALAATLAGTPLPPVDAPAFEPIRRNEEKTAAALIAALSVGLAFLCACAIAPPRAAGIATAVYALATPIWSIAAQALWQHGPVNLALLAMVYALLRSDRAARAVPARAWLAAAGLAAGLLPVIRPTAGLFSLAALAFAVWAFRRRSWTFAAAAVLGIAPGIAWNLSFFHALTGGYGGDAAAIGLDPPQAATALAGLLVSPSRGLFVFAPVLVFSFAGAVGALRVARTGDRAATLLLGLAAASIALTGVYACYGGWWGGFCYGPRFLTDTAGVAALLLVYALPRTPAARALFGLAFLVSLTVQFAGADGGAAGAEWNAVPVSVDLMPSRVWELRDSQIERNLRGAYFRFFPPSPREAPEPAAGVVALLDAQPLAGGSAILTTVDLTNDGATRLAGYRSGRYLDQVRVRVRAAGPRGAAFAQQFLYVAAALDPGEHARAIGALAVPARAGTYRLTCEPVLVGDGAVRERAPLELTLTVARGTMPVLTQGTRRPHAEQSSASSVALRRSPEARGAPRDPAAVAL
jgi:hypothetical protein